MRISFLALLVFACGDAEIYDADGDGELAIGMEGGLDCDDNDPNIATWKDEVCGNGIDDDCNGEIDEWGIGEHTWYADVDGDGWGTRRVQEIACNAPEGFVLRDGECDDTNPDISPVGLEECGNDLDEDCDGIPDNSGPVILWYPDNDHDGFGTHAGAFTACYAPAQHVQVGGDCDDADPLVNPDALDELDGKDDDCDGRDGE
jgi:hypothetical protein